MGERKGTNKYYPPDFDPKKHKSLNAYHGVHALRERGRKADQGVIIIRFEMPFNSWCLSCKQPIGMGVRYNAEKTKVGMYHSTPIYRFTMNCAMCAGAIIMQTDPQNFDYICVEGIRRKCQTWDAEENEQIVIPDYKEKQKFALDAMFQVEHGVKDREKAKMVQPAIAELEAKQNVMKDDFALNCLARRKFRAAKRVVINNEMMDAALASRLSLTGSQVKILPETDEDINKAKLIRLAHGNYKHDGKKVQGVLKDDVIFRDGAAARNKQKTPTGSSDSSTSSVQSTIRLPNSNMHKISTANSILKEKVRAAVIARRAAAFSNSKGPIPTDSVHHAALSNAVKLGHLRWTSCSGTTPSSKPSNGTENGLVAYDDSDE